MCVCVCVYIYIYTYIYTYTYIYIFLTELNLCSFTASLCGAPSRSDAWRRAAVGERYVRSPGLAHHAGAICMCVCVCVCVDR